MVSFLEYFIKLDSLCFDIESILNEMLDQCNLKKEHENAKKIKILFETCPFVKIPEIVDSGENWIIQEYMEGTDYETVRKEYPEFIGDYATKIFCIFINMVYDFKFLHADLHDGNTLYSINTNRPEDSKIILLDNMVPGLLNSKKNRNWPLLFSGPSSNCKDQSEGFYPSLNST